MCFELGQAQVKRESGHMEELMSQSCRGLVLATICSQPQPTECFAMQVNKLTHPKAASWGAAPQCLEMVCPSAAGEWSL